MKLRIGIYHEINRNRFRVRLHKFGQVIHRSYHVTLEEAEEAWDKAVQSREQYQLPEARIALRMTIPNLLSQLT